MDKKTPYYVFDFDKAKKRIETIKSLLPSNAKLCYAIKANAFLLHGIKNEDLLFEVCSEGELEICKRLKVAPEKIVFSGVMKDFQMVKKAIEYGVKTITCESISHLDHLINALGPTQSQEIILRLTSGNQFGMCHEDIKKAIETIKSDKRILLRGIHFFTGTNKKIKKIQEEVTFIQDYCSKLKDDFELEMKSIEYGPGFAFDYFCQDDFSNNLDDLKVFSQAISASTFNWTIELGRFIASPCGEYYTKICDIKNDSLNEINYIIIDGGINHINYYGQMMAMKVPPIEFISSDGTEKNEKIDYMLCGALCTTADLITKKITLPQAKIGDILKFKNIGAYSITEGIYLFLSHDLPAVYGKNSDNLVELRPIFETNKLNA